MEGFDRMTAKTAARGEAKCDEILGGVQCSRPLGHKGTHWSKELTEKHPEYFVPAHISKEAIAATSSAAPARFANRLRDYLDAIDGKNPIALYRHDIVAFVEARLYQREAAHQALYEALSAAQQLFAKGHALSRFDWGNSALRSEDIAELNELPVKITAALALADAAQGEK